MCGNIRTFRIRIIFTGNIFLLALRLFPLSFAAEALFWFCLRFTRMLWFLIQKPLTDKNSFPTPVKPV